MNNLFKYQLCFLAVTSVLSGQTFAKGESLDGIERITVSADFRQLSENQLPASASVMTHEDIEQRQATYLDEILNSAANVNFNSGAGRGRFVQIRGIGERSQFSEPLNPSVGFFVDDFDFSGTMGSATLFDVEQVEVLKGPQGTIFGSSAMAGVVKIKTADPDGIAGGRASVSLAEQNSLNLAAAYGDEINDQWQYRAAIQKYTSDGYIKNVHLNRDDTDNLDELSSRVKLRYLATDSVTLDFALHYFDIDNGYDAFSLDNVRETISDEPGFDRQETTALSTKLTWELDTFTFTGVLATSDSDIEYGYDEDWTYEGFAPGWEYSSTDYYFRTRDTDSLDLRLMSKEPVNLLGKETDWVVGANLKQTDETLIRIYTFDSDFNADYSLDNRSIYGEIYPQLSENLTLTAGLRIERASLEYVDNRSFSAKEDETFIGSRAVLDYQLAKDLMSYVSVSRGYKLGGFNPNPRLQGNERTFTGEYSWNYEIGAKQFFDNDSAYVGFALFYMDLEDTQVSEFEAVPVNEPAPGEEPDCPCEFVDVISNADIGKIVGFELESYYRFTDDLTVFANLGLLDATNEEYINNLGEVRPERARAQAPDYMFNVGFNWDLAEGWRLTLEADGKAGYFFSDGHNEQSNDFVLWHFNFNKTWEDVKFSLWGKNIFDKDYTVRGFGGFSNDPRDFYETPEPYVQFGDGRQVGFTLDYQF